MVLFMVFSSGLLAQDSKDPLNGHKNVFYPNGNLMREYDLNDGKLEGSCKMYNEEGVLYLDQYFTNGEPNGYYRIYYKNGQLRSESYMKIDQFEGPSTEYFENGKLKRDSNCTGDVLTANGIIKEYNEGGILISETTLSNGVPILVKNFFADGRPKSEQSEGNYISYTYDRDGKVVVSINGVVQK